MTTTIINRAVIFISALFLISFSSVSKEIKGRFLAEEGHFLCDTSKRILIVNRLKDPGKGVPDGKFVEFLADTLYRFPTPQTRLEPGLAYLVDDPTGRRFTLYLTELPIIGLVAQDTIRDDPKVDGSFTFADTSLLRISNNMGIEIRGGLTQIFRKKSYGIEFRNPQGEGVDVTFPGMRADDDWNLLALFNDPIRLNNRLGHDLWRAIHRPAYQSLEPEAIAGVRTRYVEVFLNGSYGGLYLLTEKIDRKQLKLKKFNGTVRGELYQTVDWTGPTTFCRAQNFNVPNRVWGGYEMKYPEEAETTSWTNLEQLVRFAVDADSTRFRQELSSYFEVANLVDYFLYINILRAGDNMGKNIFLSRYSTGSPYFFTPWDLDATLGNDFMGVPDYVTNDYIINGLYKRLLQTDTFVTQVYHRWQNLKEGPLHPDSLVERISSEFKLLKNNGLYEREAAAWDTTLNEDQVFEEKCAWVRARCSFMDGLITNRFVQPFTNVIVACTDVISIPPGTVVPPDTSVVPPDTVVVIPIPVDTVNEGGEEPITVKEDALLSYFSSGQAPVLVLSGQDLVGQSYLIFDGRGRILMDGVLTSARNEIPVHNLPKGMYVLRIHRFIHRFIIDR